MADLIVLYNDAFIPILGEKHPVALGTRLSDAIETSLFTAMVVRVCTTQDLDSAAIPFRVVVKQGSQVS
jgi:hypothetical protein